MQGLVKGISHLGGGNPVIVRLARNASNEKGSASDRGPLSMIVVIPGFGDDSRQAG
jgi:hypothetical protein